MCRTRAGAVEEIKQRYRWQVMVKSRELKPMRAAILIRAEVGPIAERDDICWRLISIQSGCCMKLTR